MLGEATKNRIGGLVSDAIGILVTDTAVHAHVLNAPGSQADLGVERERDTPLSIAFTRMVVLLKQRLESDSLGIAIAVPTRMGHVDRLTCLEGLAELDPDWCTVMSAASAGCLSQLGKYAEARAVLCFERYGGVVTASQLLMEAEPASLLVDAIAHGTDPRWGFDLGDSSFPRTDDCRDLLWDLRTKTLQAQTSAGAGASMANFSAAVVGDLATSIPFEMSVTSRLGLSCSRFGPQQVSRGAARYANALTGGEPSISVIERSGRDVGLEIGASDVFDVVISSNAILPHTTTVPMTTGEDNQPDLCVVLVEGPTDRRHNSEVIAEYTVENLPPHKAGELNLELGIGLDENGLVSVAIRNSGAEEFLSTEVRDALGEPLARQCGSCLSFSDFKALFCEACGRPFPASNIHHDAEENMVDEPSPAIHTQPAAQVTNAGPGVIDSSSTRSCPFCAEIIQRAAIKCRHCGEFLDERPLPTSLQDDSRAASSNPSEASEKDAATFNGLLFVSHASADLSVAEQLVTAFEDRRIPTWLAHRDIRVGDNYAAQIYNAITRSSHILVLLSPDGVASPHVRREVNVAIDNGIAVLPLVVTQSTDFMANLPGDWKYWLGVVQAKPFAGPDSAVRDIELLLKD